MVAQEVLVLLVGVQVPASQPFGSEAEESRPLFAKQFLDGFKSLRYLHLTTEEE